MKRTFCFLLLLILLPSCAKESIPTVTATPQATVTHTLTFTPTITLTPTIASTPTKTPPPGTTGRDSLTGEYTKTIEVNDKAVTLTWKEMQFGTDAENNIIGHWFESRMLKEQPIDLLGYGESCREEWGKISLNLNVYSVEGLRDLDEVGYLYHPDGQSDYIARGYPCNSLSSELGFDLFLNYYDLLAEEPESYSDYYFSKERRKKFDEKYPPSDPDSNGHMYNDWLKFVSALNQGAFIQVEGKRWELQKGYDVYYIDETMAMEDASMHLSIQARTTENFYWKVTVNDGKLIAVIAPAGWLKTQLSWPKAQSRESHFRFVTLFPLQAVLTTSKLSEDMSPFRFQDYGSLASPGGLAATSFIAFTPIP